MVPPTVYIHLKSLLSINVSLFLEKGSLQTSLRILKWDHLNYPGGHLSPMTSALKIRNTQKGKTEEKAMWHRSRNWSDATIRNVSSYKRDVRFARRASRRSGALLIPSFQTSDSSKCDRINLWCFKSSSVWYVVAAASGNYYTIEIQDLSTYCKAGVGVKVD